ncbi:MAG: glucuronate isomerase [Verrucomicrobia bacterium]|nr:glucuronate isomerase [Verrucomicrobiota bacterium]
MSAPVLITEDFLLENKMARRLYHHHASAMPILDYHCHLPPGEIAADHRYQNLTDLWLRGDHYKWRAMRACGVGEAYCTGGAPDRSKFDHWAQTLPKLIRNPLYHWSHLELARYFGIDDKLLSAATADSIWEACHEQITSPAFSCRSLMRQSGVVLVCTTDDPVDSLEHHQAIAADETFDIQVLPTWRPDKGMAIEDVPAFNAWLDRLADAADVHIRDWSSYLEALQRRHRFFHEAGCRLSDHGLETLYAESYTETEVEAIFASLRSGRPVANQQALMFKSAMLMEFGRMDHARGWTQQFHLGALRGVNTRMQRLLGPDTGFDTIGTADYARPLATFLDRLDQTEQLAPTILYNLNPRDNPVMATMIGNFQDGLKPGKIQWGSAWWFLDQLDGMERQLEMLSQIGVLSCFVGMLTDSRSFLSYTRHEYFRRLLCNMLGRDVERGRLPNDEGLLGGIVRDIAYRNAAGYFGFRVPAA